MNILVLNGPNLNLLGKREPDVYGSMTLDDIISDLGRYAESVGVNLSHFQSNAECELIEQIHKVLTEPLPIQGIVINPAAFTHTSVAIRDALLAVNLPIIEVHLSNVHARESFRHHSFISDIADGVIVGLGHLGYRFAVDALVSKYTTENN